MSDHEFPLSSEFENWLSTEALSQSSDSPSDFRSLIEISEYWSSKLSESIERFEAARRRIKLFSVAFSAAIVPTATMLPILLKITLVNNSGSEGISFTYATALGAACIGVTFAIMFILNEIQNSRTLKEEISDTYHVFKKVHQLFVATTDQMKKERPYRYATDTQGRLMMMSYIERKALRYVGKPQNQTS